VLQQNVQRHTLLVHSQARQVCAVACRLTVLIEAFYSSLSRVLASVSQKVASHAITAQLSGGIPACLLVLRAIALKSVHMWQSLHQNLLQHCTQPQPSLRTGESQPNHTCSCNCLYPQPRPGQGSVYCDSASDNTNAEMNTSSGEHLWHLSQPKCAPATAGLQDSTARLPARTAGTAGGTTHRLTA
jgi:hypothetical protein